LATRGIEIHNVPGDHSSYIRGHVQITTRTIRECLEKAVWRARGPHRL